MRQIYAPNIVQGWPGHEAQLEQWQHSHVSVATLQNPPDKGEAGTLAQTFTRLIAGEGRSTPRSEGVNWVPKDLTPSREFINCVPMNSAAYARIDSPNRYLATGNLNGCTAVAVASRVKPNRYALDAFLAHYDPEAVCEVDENGRLKLSGLLAEFVGGPAVDVVIAYPESAKNLPQLRAEGYNPADYPTEALVEDAQQLPAGSNILMLPYKASQEGVANPVAWRMLGRTFGSTLHVGQGTASRTQFGWNGENVPVGKLEMLDDRRMNAAREVNRLLTEQMEAELRSMLE